MITEGCERVRAVVICPARTSVGRSYTTSPSLSPTADERTASLLLKEIPALRADGELLLVILGNVEGPMDLFDRARGSLFGGWLRGENTRATHALLMEGMRASGARTSERAFDPHSVAPVATGCLFVSLADVELPAWLRAAFPPRMRGLRCGLELVRWFCVEPVPETVAAAAAASRDELMEKRPLLSAEDSARQIRLRYALRRAAGALAHAVAAAARAPLLRTSFLSPQPGDDLEWDASASTLAPLDHRTPLSFTAPAALRWATLAAAFLPVPPGPPAAGVRAVMDEIRALPPLTAALRRCAISIVVTADRLDVEDLAFLAEPADVRIVIDGDGTSHVAIPTSEPRGTALPPWAAIIAAHGPPLRLASAPANLAAWSRIAARACLRAPVVPRHADPTLALIGVRAALLAGAGAARIRGADPWLLESVGAVSAGSRTPGGALPMRGAIEAADLFGALARAPDGALARVANARLPASREDRLDLVEGVVGRVLGAGPARAARAAFISQFRARRGA